MISILLTALTENVLQSLTAPAINSTIIIELTALTAWSINKILFIVIEIVYSFEHIRQHFKASKHVNNFFKQVSCNFKLKKLNSPL